MNRVDRLCILTAGALAWGDAQNFDSERNAALRAREALAWIEKLEAENVAAPQQTQEGRE